MNRKRFLRAVKLLLVAAVISISVFAYFRRHDILDAWTLRSYQPPQKIAELADQTSMNSYGKRLFYVNNPQLQGKQVFVDSCGNRERTIVLGCYVPSKGIYLLEVTDERLVGVEQVTSAHEMLHAGYERLTAKNRRQVDQWLDEAFRRVTNQRIISTIDQYRKDDPSVVHNELHSILGTEVRNLSPELEIYYQRYFINRSAVVSYAERYEQVFLERRQKVDDLDHKLHSLEEEIKSDNITLDSEFKELDQQRGHLDYLRSSDVVAYNAYVPSFNLMVNRYNAKVRMVDAKIQEYKNILAERNAVAEEAQEMVRSLDSSAIEKRTPL